MSQAETKPTGMSPQTRQAIGIGGLVLCLLIGGGIIYWFLFGASPSRREVDIDPNQRTNTLRGRQMPTPRIKKTNANDWIVRGDMGGIHVSKTASDYQLIFRYQPGTLGFSQQQITLMSGVFRIRQDPAMAKAWGVTPEQAAKLKKIDLGGVGLLNPSNEDRAAFRKMWDDFLNASDKGPPQTKLIEKLDQVAKANLEPSKKSVLATFDLINQILTPEQVQKITK